MKLSIVVPAYNEEKLITETLRRIRAAAAALVERGWECELIVCDNNSTDRTGELAQAEGAVVVFEPVNQIARARNCGAAVATGDWVLFVDADSHPSRELLLDVAAAIESGRYVAGGSTMKLDAPYFAAALVTRLWNRVSRMTKWVAGSFIFCDLSVFREVGGFGQHLYAAEEIDFSKRMKPVARKHGKKIVILHRHPLITSARKMHLYTPREHLRLLSKTIFSRGAVLTKREQCQIWYDGRR